MLSFTCMNSCEKNTAWPWALSIEYIYSTCQSYYSVIWFEIQIQESIGVKHVVFYFSILWWRWSGHWQSAIIWFGQIQLQIEYTSKTFKHPSIFLTTYWNFIYNLVNLIFERKFIIWNFFKQGILLQNTPFHFVWEWKLFFFVLWEVWQKLLQSWDYKSGIVKIISS